MERLGYVKVKEILKITTEERLWSYFLKDMDLNSRLRYPACSALAGK